MLNALSHPKFKQSLIVAIIGLLIFTPAYAVGDIPTVQAWLDWLLAWMTGKSAKTIVAIVLVYYGYRLYFGTVDIHHGLRICIASGVIFGAQVVVNQATGGS